MQSQALGFAVVMWPLWFSHWVSDYWLQTDHQAEHKHEPSWFGRRACAGHVATHVAVNTVATLLVTWWFGLEAVTLQGVLWAQAAIGVSHYFADRRGVFFRFAEKAGKGKMLKIGAVREGKDDAFHLGTGAHFLDQSWHRAWLVVGGLLTVSF